MKIAIAGSSGRMGRTLIEAVLNDPEMQLAAALDVAGSPFLGKDAGELVGSPCGVPINDDFDAALAGVDPGGFTLLAAHQPLQAFDVEGRGVDLQVSGHTHGGQVCLPFYGPFFTASLYGRRFQSGRYLIEKMALYITRGIGLEGKAAPRIRFLCPPEIIYWEIIGTGAAQQLSPKE